MRRDFPSSYSKENGRIYDIFKLVSKQNQLKGMKINLVTIRIEYILIINFDR